MSKAFKVVLTCIFCVPLVLLGATALIAGNSGSETPAALMLLIGGIPLVLLAWWVRAGHGGVATGEELRQLQRSLDLYDQNEERLDEPRDLYGGMTQRDMNTCCDSVRTFIHDGGLKDRKPTSTKQVKELLRGFFRAGLHLVDAEDALEDNSADILAFFNQRHMVHKKATHLVLSGQLDAPEVIVVFALEMLNGKRVGKTYLEWKALRASA